MGSEVLNTSISKWSYLIYCFVLFGRVDEDRLRECSPVLARLFLQSIFISVDIRIREGHLFCDCLCDSGPLYNGQVIVLRLFYQRFQVFLSTKGFKAIWQSCIAHPYCILISHLTNACALKNGGLFSIVGAHQRSKSSFSRKRVRWRVIWISFRKMNINKFSE